MGIILSGSVDVVEEDFWGNRTILNRMHQGDSFAEAYAICSAEPLIIGVVAGPPVVSLLVLLWCCCWSSCGVVAGPPVVSLLVLLWCRCWSYCGVAAGLPVV